MHAPSRDGEILEGKYRLLRKLGEGAMGAVYAGENLRIRRTVAIKILHAAASAIGEMADRFEREAQAAGQIGNDHITEVYDLGTTASGERYMVMEYLEGETLRGRIKRLKRLAPGQAVHLVGQLLEGLDAAHRAGIVHRDVKPDNIFVMKEKAGRRDFVKILDFGISKFTQQVGEGSTTRTGTVMGSPNYMSPEHVRGTHEVDDRSDLYSAGVILYEALTGTIPRNAKNFAELLFKIAYEPMPDPRTLVPELPEAIVDVVMRACASDRAQRFQNALEFAAALDDAARGLEVGPETRELTGLALAPPSWAGRSQPNFGSQSQPGSSSQPGAGSQPNFGASSQVGSSSQPNPMDASAHSWKSAPAPVAWSAAQRNALEAADGSQPDANGTAIISVDGIATSNPLPPSAFAPSAAASVGSSSQPGFGSSSQPGFGSSSQPGFGSSSQPSFGGGVSTSATMSLTTATAPAEPKKGRRGLAIAIASGVVIGGAAILIYAFVAVPSGSQTAAGATTTGAMGTSTAAPDVTVAATSTALGTPSSADALADAASASSTPSAPASAATVGATPAKPDPKTPIRPTIRPNTRVKGPDPGY